ncbi:MAG: D-aminoacyl-tRNA deacylase [Chlamydiia bacterium]|nr:D-aminoacyl-tRNA deacylase [Chlamydiia bacterium]MCH9616678.1 D-aminoacyl-tRNA deacylase [Chlamydiia bacterium]MCH9629409.1 D-aminoacyl-tRNA deacylase [Chlamydiia bacterium]
MRMVIQKVTKAQVDVDGQTVGKIGKGLLVLVGFHKDDNDMDLDEFAEKLIYLRIFEDENSKMNLSLKDVDGSVLVVSQFTLQADTSKGRRPSFTKAAKPEVAKPLYNTLVESLKQKIGKEKVATGEFGSHMEVHLTNDGPTTLLFD